MGTDPSAATVLTEGIPPWMARRLWNWVDEGTSVLGHALYSGPEELVTRFDEAKRLEDPLVDELGQHTVSESLAWRDDDELTLAYTDYLIYLYRSVIPEKNKVLDEIFESSGSAWRVGSRRGLSGLERRVKPAIREAAEGVMSSSGDAGDLLSEAWHATYGMTPDPSKAYGLAIKAVEEAGVHIVSPKNLKATLGSMIADVANQKTWRLSNEKASSDPEASALLRMMRSLWNGQTSRHGGNGQRPETQREVEAAVFLAVTLVQVFHAGLFEK